MFSVQDSMIHTHGVLRDFGKTKKIVQHPKFMNDTILPKKPFGKWFIK